MQLIEECIHSYSYFDNFDRIQFRIEVEEGINFKSEWVIVNTILQNLIENSIKYIRDNAKKPYVLVQVYTEGSLLYIKVTDNGQGIAEEYREKIYEIFFRANDRAAGSGLGLYILKRAVERLQGTVTLKSKPGKGSAFIVCIKGT
jgi:signal transduction histidine kinase